MKKTINILDFVQNIMGAKLDYLTEISKSYWSHTGNFSVTNLSRWVLSTSKRSLERFYARPHDWFEHMGVLIISFLSRHAHFIKDFNQHWVFAGDETVDKKSGHATHGISYAYSSKAEKVIKGMSVLNISLVHRYAKLSLPFLQEQLIFPTDLTGKAAKKKASKKARKAAKSVAKQSGVPFIAAKLGRPKGSKNAPKTPTEPTEGIETEAKEEIAYTFQVLERLLDRFSQFFKERLSPYIRIKYFVGDGGFGNNTVAKIVRSKGLQLISKLQYNAALYFPFKGVYSGRGPHPKYGEKLNFDKAETQLEDYFVEEQEQKQKDGSIDRIYQIKNMLHKSFDMPLNVVVILRFDKNRVPKSHKSRVVLFSTDLEADHKTIMDIYHVRYQIEFNFRDARQFFGLSNFKNIKKPQVQNVIGYAFFMVTLSNILLFEIKHKYPESKFSIQDLKAYFRAEKYLNELLNKDEFTTSLFLNLKQNINLPIIGAINPF
jgi:putative transposase